MGFEKIEKKNARSSQLGVPAINLTKNTSAFNLKFCDANDLKVVGTKIGVNFYHDKDTGAFAFEVNFKKTDGYDSVCTYNKSHQVQIYLRSMLKSMGYVITKPVACPLEYNKKAKMWIFEIPESCKVDPEAQAEEKSVSKEAKKSKKKLKRKKKDAKKIKSKK